MRLSKKTPLSKTEKTVVQKAKTGLVSVRSTVRLRVSLSGIYSSAEVGADVERTGKSVEKLKRQTRKEAFQAAREGLREAMDAVVDAYYEFHKNDDDQP